MGRGPAVAVVLAALSVACGVLVAAQSDGTPTATPPGAPSEGSGDGGPKVIGDAAIYDGPPLEGGVADAGGCASDAGSPMVALEIGGKRFCVDATEVTNADYDRFLAAKVPIAGQVPECAWNTNFGRNCNDAGTTNPEQPMVCSDWCDAMAYCRWAGRRLCGLLGQGGANVPLGSFGDPHESEWSAVCTAGGTKKYPYGNVAEAGACPADGAPISVVGSYPRCIGGYAGIHEMAGNVGEWEASCSGATGRDDLCRVRGGEIGDPFDQQFCGQDYTQSRGARDPAIGFRCCSDL